jgi:hypothetical protein
VSGLRIRDFVGMHYARRFRDSNRQRFDIGYAFSWLSHTAPSGRILLHEQSDSSFCRYLKVSILLVKKWSTVF